MSTLHAPRRALVVVALLSAAVLGTTVADAAPVYEGASVSARAGAGTVDIGTCTVEQTRSAPVLNLPLVPDATPQRLAASTTGTMTKNGDATDVIAFSGQWSGSAGVTSSGGDPRRLDLEASGQVEATATRQAAGCELYLLSPIEIAYGFTVTHAGFLTVTLRAEGLGRAEFFLHDHASGEPTIELSGTGPRFEDVSTVYLSAGRYEGGMKVEALLRTRSTTAPTTTASSVRAEFVGAGAQTRAPRGRARRYLTLPSTRSCATGALVAAVTTDKRLARRIQKVRLLVDDRVVAKVRTPRRGQALTARLDAARAADVRVGVTLRPKRDRPARTYEAGASYARCS